MKLSMYYTLSSDRSQEYVMIKGMSGNTTAIQNRYRTEDQTRYGRKRVAELALQGFGPTRIHEILVSEGHDLTLRQVSYDLKRVRENWLVAQEEAFEELVQKELFRLDMMERELWESVRLSTRGTTRTTVEKIVKKRWGDEESDDVVVTDEELELMINRITETTEEKSAPDPRYLSQIIEVQKERRRLLGLYAPKKLSITEEIKAYAIVSPADWPQAAPPKVIDG